MMSKLIPLICLSIGIFILMQVVLPVISFQVWEIQNLAPETLLVSPEKNDQQVLGISIEQGGDNFPKFISAMTRDTPASYNQFTITIPALKIANAKVLVDTNDLNQGALAQLPGSALPGEKGNLFISGHSAIPLIYNTDKNYGVMFANLPQLKKGDQIHISAGVNYTYQVVGMRVVDPKDLSVIPPPDSQGRYISLMTCVPPGLNTHRLVVLGKLI